MVGPGGSAGVYGVDRMGGPGCAAGVENVGRVQRLGFKCGVGVQKRRLAGRVRPPLPLLRSPRHNQHNQQHQQGPAGCRGGDNGCAVAGLAT